jgi:hypothetical protein
VYWSNSTNTLYYYLGFYGSLVLRRERCFCPLPPACKSSERFYEGASAPCASRCTTRGHLHGAERIDHRAVGECPAEERRTRMHHGCHSARVWPPTPPCQKRRVAQEPQNRRPQLAHFWEHLFSLCMLAVSARKRRRHRRLLFEQGHTDLFFFFSLLCLFDMGLASFTLSPASSQALTQETYPLEPSPPQC